MCHKCPKPSKVVVFQPSTEQKTKKTLFAGDWEDERIHLTGYGCLCCIGGRGRSGVQHRRDIFSCFLINACSSLRSLLCLFEINIALQPKIQGNLGDLYEQNDVSVSKVQFRFKVFIPRIPSVFRYRGKSLALLTVVNCKE